MKKPSIFNIRAYKEYRSNISKDEVDMAFTGAQDDTTLNAMYALTMLTIDFPQTR